MMTVAFIATFMLGFFIGTVREQRYWMSLVDEYRDLNRDLLERQ